MATLSFNIFLRTITRNKLFTITNVSGLALGLACCIALLMYTKHELSYDQHQQHAKELYLVGSESSTGVAANQKFPYTTALYGPAIKSQFPEVAAVSRLYVNLIDEKTLLRVQTEGGVVRSFFETNGYHVDSTFLDLFSYNFIEGSPRSALSEPNAIVLTEDLAKKLFGDGPALNRIVRVGGSSGEGKPFKVTGIFRDQRQPSHIDARFFLSNSVGWIGDFLRNEKLDFANNNIFFTYLRLRPGTNVRALERKLGMFVSSHLAKDAVGTDRKFFLVPVTELHLYDQFQSVVSETTSRGYLSILIVIALFTLLIACVNFMNLSTARSAKRAAEVGVRKVMGAQMQTLIVQFLAESMILSFMALIVALNLLSLLLPFFNDLTQKHFLIADIFRLDTISIFIGLTFATGLLAGSYPAFYISGFEPLRVLKGKFQNSLSAITLRKTLVVFQFCVSIGLVLATLIIREQMQYLRNAPLGFQRDHQLIIPLRSSEARKAYHAFRNDILRNSQVISAAGTQYYPGIRNPNDFNLYKAGTPSSNNYNVKANGVDFELLQTLGFEVITGRLFSREFPADTNNKLVVNEALLRKFHIPVDQAVGQKLAFDWQNATFNYEIVGVVKDFHFRDLHETITPYAFQLLRRPQFNYIVVHLRTDELSALLEGLTIKWKSLVSDEPFEYTFLNEDFHRNYEADTRTSRIVSVFTLFSILISCLGLFGLASFSAQQRVKEIGVRKVLGASVESVVLLLAKDFMKLVLISAVIALPVTSYLMQGWLERFAYRTNIPWWIYASVTFLSFIIAFLAVGYQSIRAALSNPVDSLRSE